MAGGRSEQQSWLETPCPRSTPPRGPSNDPEGLPLPWLRSSGPSPTQQPLPPPPAEEKKKLAEEKAMDIEEQNKIIAVEKAEAETALAEVMPILEAAKLELQKLDKSDVTEIRYCGRLPLARPPSLLKAA